MSSLLSIAYFCLIAESSLLALYTAFIPAQQSGTRANAAVIMIGEDRMGGYANDPYQNNSTYELFPSVGTTFFSQFLNQTLPANLYPLTWLLPSGKLFIQANWQAELLDLSANKETFLGDIPHAVRTYPASAATVLLPLTPENNYEATVLICVGSNIAVDAWNPATNVIIDIPANSTCARISPDGDAKWEDDTTGLSGSRTLPLPCTLLSSTTRLNRTFSRVGLGNSTIDRLYHSTALLLPDGSVFVAGSNPHADYTINTTYPTEYRWELFFPWYYFERRPEPAGLLSQLSYGGSYFDVTLSSDDMSGDAATNAPQTKAVITRTGFSTYGLNIGQRYLELNSTYTVNLDGTVTLHVSQLPAHATLFPPGPAAIHIVVAGVPSVGKMIMVGSGKIETQALLAVTPLPPSGVQANDTQTNSTGDGGNGGGPSVHASSALGLGASATFALASLLAVAGLSFTV
ncbi:DUF1929-domain-containing protein [Clavulina sp. PMI_390]|nr:DUF1929-domain-containing protein [Clavulina sp. PMI_390]